MSRVVRHNGHWFVAYPRGRLWVAPGHTGMKDAPLAVVGTLDQVVVWAYGYKNKADAIKRAEEIFPYDNTAFHKEAA